MDSLADYIVSADGKSHKVKILRMNHHKNAALLELDGKAVEVTFSGLPCFDEHATISVNDKNHRIMLIKNDKFMTFDVEVGGNRFSLQVKAKKNGVQDKTVRALRKEKFIGKKNYVVTSPMPGRVILMKVKIGDKVRASDPLCILEAMKMENEIITPKGGTINQIKVESGSIVKSGETLVVIGRARGQD